MAKAASKIPKENPHMTITDGDPSTVKSAQSRARRRALMIVGAVVLGLFVIPGAIGALRSTVSGPNWVSPSAERVAEMDTDIAAATEDLPDPSNMSDQQINDEAWTVVWGSLTPAEQESMCAGWESYTTEWLARAAAGSGGTLNESQLNDYMITSCDSIGQ